MTLEQILKKYNYSYPLRRHEIQKIFLTHASQDTLENIRRTYANQYGDQALKYLDRKYPAWIDGSKNLGWSQRTFEKVNWAIEINYNQEIKEITDFQNFIRNIATITSSWHYRTYIESSLKYEDTLVKVIEIDSNYQQYLNHQKVRLYENANVSFDLIKNRLKNRKSIYRFIKYSSVTISKIVGENLEFYPDTQYIFLNLNQGHLNLIEKYYKSKEEIFERIKKRAPRFKNEQINLKTINHSFAKINSTLDLIDTYEGKDKTISIHESITLPLLNIELCENFRSNTDLKNEGKINKINQVCSIISSFCIIDSGIFFLIFVIAVFGISILNIYLVLPFLLCISLCFLTSFINSIIDKIFNELYHKLTPYTDFKIKSKNIEIDDINLFEIVETKLSKFNVLLKNSETLLKPYPKIGIQNYPQLYVQDKRKPTIKKYIDKQKFNQSITKKDTKIPNYNKPTETISNILNLESKSAESDGLLGEQLIMEYEKDRIAKFDLSTSIRHRSQEKNGDRYGYDIESILENRRMLFIEVKTTRGNIKTPFIITRNEFNKMKELSKIGEYAIYRISLYDSHYKLIKIIGIENIESKFDFSPIDYTYKLSTFSDIKSIDLDLNT